MDAENRIYKLLGYKGALRKEDLPEEYLEGYPNYYLTDDWGSIVLTYIPETYGKQESSPCEVCLIPGELYAELVTKIIIRHMRIAGNRLYEINKNNKKPIKTFTVKI